MRSPYERRTEPRIQLEQLPAARRSHLGAKLLLVGVILGMSGLAAAIAALMSR